MKKTLILLLGAVLLLNATDIKVSENNSTKYIYKTSKKFQLKENTEKLVYADYQVFNKQGKLIEEKRVSDYYSSINYYSYDKNGNKIKKVYESLSSPKDNDTTYYIYDDNGVLTETKRFNINNELVSHREIALDEKPDNNHIKIEYAKDGKPIKIVEETYGSSSSILESKPLEEKSYYGKQITTYSYDKARNEIKKEFLDRSDHIDKKVYTYDKSWNLLSEKNTTDSNHTVYEHYILYKEYDEKNNLTREYTKVIKNTSACRGGLSYATPNYDKRFIYNKNNKLIEIDTEQRTILNRGWILVSKYRTLIEYEYLDALR
jgi:hypothetical protein